ncbi:hypothetical protein AAY473_027388 [Plecturocebus cupreus]
MAIYGTNRKALEETNAADTLILNFQPLELLGAQGFPVHPKHASLTNIVQVVETKRSSTALAHVIKTKDNKENNQQNEQTTHKMEENICKLPPDKGLITRIYKEFKQLYKKKSNNLIFKMGKRYE